MNGELNYRVPAHTLQNISSKNRQAGQFNNLLKPITLTCGTLLVKVYYTMCGLLVLVTKTSNVKVTGR